MGDSVPSGVRVQTLGVFCHDRRRVTPVLPGCVHGLVLLERHDKLLALLGRELRLEAQCCFGNLQHLLLLGHQDGHSGRHTGSQLELRVIDSNHGVVIHHILHHDGCRPDLTHRAAHHLPRIGIDRKRRLFVQRRHVRCPPH